MTENTNNEVRQLEKTGTCVLCGATYKGWGHNPEPVAKFEDGRACDDCNQTKVIPTRIGRVLETRKGQD